MNMSDDFRITIIEDFEKLLDLAEESSMKIDYLLQLREKQKIMLLSVTTAMYVLVMLTYFLARYLPIAVNKEISVSLIFVIAITASSYFLFRHLLLMKKLRRELYIERNIHETLISMLDTQKQRLLETDILSSVSYAIYEIRLKRLDRTDRKIY